MTQLKENSAGKALNSIGRSTGRRFNMAAMKREFVLKQQQKINNSVTFDEHWEADRIKRIAVPVKTLTF